MSSGLFSKLPEDQLLGLCIDREARGEPYLGRVAVGSVVLNRVGWGQAHPKWGRLYGDTIRSVILAPAQFSWTIENPFDPNYLGAVEITKDFMAAIKNPENDWLESNLEISQGLISGEIKRITTALYYHAKSISPPWAKRKIPILTIGEHIFYV